MSPLFVLVKVCVTAEKASAAAREERMCQNSTWTVERFVIAAAVVPSCESDLNIWHTGGFRKRQS